MHGTGGYTIAELMEEEAVALLVDLQAKVGPASIRRHGLAVLSTGGTPRVASNCSLTSFTALVSVVVFLGVVGVAEFADGAGGEVRQDEAVGAVDAEVLADEGREPGHVFLQDRVALGPELADGGVEVDGGPQHDAVQDEAEGA
jgi:hypothetical protein